MKNSVLPGSVSTMLIIGKVWPEPASSAAGSRMMQLIRLLKDAGYRIVFVTTAGESEHNALHKVSGIEVAEIGLNDSSFDEFVRNLNPVAVIFDRFMTEEQFGWRVAEQCPDTVRILDTEDLHSLRHTREWAWKSGVKFKPEFMFDHDITKREIAAICRSDLSLIISEAEMNLLLNHFPVEPEQLFYLPLLVEPIRAEAVKTLPGFSERKGFSTIGNFLHEPNRNSVRFLKEEIWPLIREQLNEAELYVYGAYPAQQDMELHSPQEGFHLIGRVEDAPEAIQATRVLLAPLRFGAGLKGKLFSAMKSGTPSVTTPIGAEGIASADEWGGFVAEQAEDFAAQAVKLYNDEQVWSAAQKRGVNILNERFPAEAFAETFTHLLHRIISDPEKHRKTLFTGSMLMHHTMASHQYMSKWIEEKQKNKP